MTGSPRRAYLKLDRYASFDLARQHSLRASDRCVLLSLVLLADFRSHRCQLSITDLADHSGVSRRTASTAVIRLRAAGLIEMEEPFGSGRPGTVLVSAYWTLVVPERKPARGSTSGLVPIRFARAPDLLVTPRDDQVPPTPDARAEFAPVSRPLRATSRERDALTRGDTILRGSEGVRSGMEEGNCGVCGAPITGHIYGDHDPVRADTTRYTDGSPPVSDADLARWDSSDGDDDVCCIGTDLVAE